MSKLVENEIQASGCTDIRKAVEKGFEVMLARKEVNETTAVFLLSDGEDTCGNSLKCIKEGIDQKHKLMEGRDMKYQIHTFGYGEEHDENVLTMISDTTGGEFYYIKTDSYVDECFIDCFGYLMSIFATDVRIQLEIDNGFELKDAFSVFWKKEDNKNAALSLYGLAVGKRLDYITEIGFVKKELKFEDELKTPIGKVTMEYKFNGKEYSIQKELNIKLVERESDKGEGHVEVSEAYARAMGVRAMNQARRLIEQGQFGAAQRRLESYHNKMNYIPTIGGSFKKKLARNVSYGHVNDYKDMMQVQRMMVDNAYNPEYSSFLKQNRTQRRFRKKKKGF